MADVTDGHEVLIWADGDRVALVENVLGRMGAVAVLAVAGPRKGEISDLGKIFSVNVGDDLRQMLVEKPAGSLLLATRTGVKREDLAYALGLGMDILSLEPIGEPMERPVANEKRGRLVHIPMWRLSPGWLSASDPRDVLGKVRSLDMHAVGTADSGSLYSRLYDAMDMALGLLGMPLMVRATLVGPLTAVPDDLRALTGYVTVQMSYGGEAGTLITLTDRGFAWQRRLSIIGESGQMCADDTGYQLIGGDTREHEILPDADHEIDWARLIAHQWRWMLEHRNWEGGGDARLVNALCETVLLSCRTGQGESPSVFMRATPA